MVSYIRIIINLSKKKNRADSARFSGAGSRTRTDDLRITNALLYQLSHTSD